jgi:tetratricopeptide (TPR) repeat protein
MAVTRATPPPLAVWDHPFYRGRMARKLRPLVIAGALLISIAQAADRPLPEIYNEARAALEAGNAARCVELLQPVVKPDAGPEAAPAQLALGAALVRLGKAADAVPYLTQAAASLGSSPELVNALAPLGDALRLADRRKDAREVFERAAKTGETLNARYAAARAQELRGEDHQEAGRFADAAADYLAAADALLKLAEEDPAYLVDARAIYEKVAKGTGKPGKDWRGEPTARAVYGMGEVERASGHLPEAIAYYQRTFVSWMRYPHWAARAYLRAAECMDKLGKRTFAIRHLREMVRKIDRYGKLPEYEQAKKQLRAWGEEVW